MLTFSQLIVRLLIAMVLGALVGLEREFVGKEAGIRTSMLVSGGASVFTMVALTLPYITASASGSAPDMAALNSAVGIIANIVVGIGFLGAGIIIKTGEHVHGLTTAAVVWVAAAIGTLSGLGMTKFAIVTAVLMSGSLYVLRKVGVYEKIHPENR